MRKINLMNDLSEFEYGEKTLEHVLTGSLCNEFNNCLKGIDVSREDFYSKYRIIVDLFKRNSYILSLTNQEETENDCGRLSMWREYGRDDGVAFVFDRKVFIDMLIKIISAYKPNREFPICELLVPIYYDDGEKIIINDFKNIFTRIKNYSKDYVQKIGNELIEERLILNMCFSILMQKHPGFNEEKEMRFCVSLLSDEYVDGMDQFIRMEDVVINNIEQRILKLELGKLFKKKNLGISWNKLINKIIIGPMIPEKGYALKEYIYDRIRCRDNTFEINKIVLSSIPYRKPLR